MLRKMDNIESNLRNEPQRSILSDFNGVVAQKDDALEENLSMHGDKMTVEYVNWSDRLYNYLSSTDGTEYINTGPAHASGNHTHLFQFFNGNDVWRAMMSEYYALAWDSITYRISLTDPKGLAGAIVVGVYPYALWYGATWANESVYNFASDMQIQRMFSGPNTALMPYAEGSDFTVDIPWQYNTSHITTNVIRACLLTSSALELPPPGTPVLFMRRLVSTSVSTISKPAEFRVYIKFNGLRFLAPTSKGPLSMTESMVRGMRLTKQSGLEAAAAVAATEMASVVGEEILSSLSNTVGQISVTDRQEADSYERPAAVQQSYAGDTTSAGSPPNLPVFRGYQPSSGRRHQILDFLKRPQYIGLQTVNNSIVKYFANPMGPLALNFTGATSMCSWFRFFGQAATYWRGTINFHFVILGHPMIEVFYRLQSQWNDTTYDEDGETILSKQPTLEGMCHGTTHLIAPCPFMTQRDWAPVLDIKGLPEQELNTFTPSAVSARFRLVSTMLDVDPVVSVAVFYSAGDDFEFYQPYPVGFYKNEDVAAVRAMAAQGKLKKQMQLPPVVAVMESSAKTMLPIDQMKPIRFVEDLMEIWSRCLPYGSYDSNDEPQPIISYGVSPMWFPMHGGSASHTYGVNNSWWITNDYISLYSSAFLFFRGSIAMKVLCKADGTGYKYISLSNQYQFMRQPTNNPFTWDSDMVPPLANFGAGTVISPTASQPVLEITIPQRSEFAWGLNNPQVYVNVAHNDTYLWFSQHGNGFLHSNVHLLTPNGDDLDVTDALFRKIGDDFELGVPTLLPPPYLWVAKGWDWD